MYVLITGSYCLLSDRSQKMSQLYSLFSLYFVSLLSSPLLSSPLLSSLLFYIHSFFFILFTLFYIRPFLFILLILYSILHTYFPLYSSHSLFYFTYVLFSLFYFFILLILYSILHTSFPLYSSHSLLYFTYIHSLQPSQNLKLHLSIIIFSSIIFLGGKFSSKELFEFVRDKSSGDVVNLRLAGI